MLLPPTLQIPTLTEGFPWILLRRISWGETHSQDIASERLGLRVGDTLAISAVEPEAIVSALTGVSVQSSKSRKSSRVA